MISNQLVKNSIFKPKLLIVRNLDSNNDKTNYEFDYLNSKWIEFKGLLPLMGIITIGAGAYTSKYIDYVPTLGGSFLIRKYKASDFSSTYEKFDTLNNNTRTDFSFSLNGSVFKPQKIFKFNNKTYTIDNSYPSANDLIIREINMDTGIVSSSSTEVSGGVGGGLYEVVTNKDYIFILISNRALADHKLIVRRINKNLEIEQVATIKSLGLYDFQHAFLALSNSALYIRTYEYHSDYATSYSSFIRVEIGNLTAKTTILDSVSLNTPSAYGQIGLEKYMPIYTIDNHVFMFVGGTSNSTLRELNVSTGLTSAVSTTGPVFTLGTPAVW